MGSIKLINELRLGGGGLEMKEMGKKLICSEFLILQEQKFFYRKTQVYIKGENDRMRLK